ncbi:interleukin-17D-like isoform X1 [Bufo gargarizans]|uniref:interleukin-17D-like isoform X1 n=2 Tax=Bufo gargarizans TaxID=30331 RepID=UPI001CF1DE8A|nr:interleukin-17D-like isoform X1 [Bufo gargarizans]
MAQSVTLSNYSLMKKLLFPVILILSCTLCQGHRIRCKDPSEEHLKQKYQRLSPESLLISKTDYVPDVKMKRCPTSVNVSSELMQDRSISPWSYRINEDMNRYPREIVEAYCLCKGCVTSKESSMVSEPFYREVPVLYKSSKCKKSRYVYKLRSIRIAQFCICRFH